MSRKFLITLDKKATKFVVLEAYHFLKLKLLLGKNDIEVVLSKEWGSEGLAVFRSGGILNITLLESIPTDAYDFSFKVCAEAYAYKLYLYIKHLKNVDKLSREEQKFCSVYLAKYEIKTEVAFNAPKPKKKPKTIFDNSYFRTKRTNRVQCFNWAESSTELIKGEDCGKNPSNIS
jgi:hypothetical protein